MNALLERSIVWDNHAALPLRPHDEHFLPQLERYRQSGVTVVSVNVGFEVGNIESHVRMLAHFRRWLKERPEQFLLIERVEDIHRAKESGRLGVCFDVEGAGAIDDQLSLIGLYYELGVRWMLMAYNVPNRVGGGCMEVDSGLTEFGVRVIDEMARVGMVACCSHTGERTALEVIQYSKNPVIFSHSNPRALWEHPRNIRDEVIRACAAKGGVIGINGVGVFLGANDTRSQTVANHIDYVAKLAGIDHVALGLDYVFDNEELVAYLKARPEVFGKEAEVPTIDFVAPEQVSEIADCLISMGYAEVDVQRIFGLNWLRIASIWK
ncbi:MAG: dipeptidase [Candidatus Eremiobacteraeota bacterium]|nr:dipeptidase [Candidatus Eremiobacteraeota bacterium]